MRAVPGNVKKRYCKNFYHTRPEKSKNLLLTFTVGKRQRALSKRESLFISEHSFNQTLACSKYICLSVHLVLLKTRLEGYKNVYPAPPAGPMIMLSTGRGRHIFLPSRPTPRTTPPKSSFHSSRKTLKTLGGKNL